jgi:hypothetical protein
MPGFYYKVELDCVEEQSIRCWLQLPLPLMRGAEQWLPRVTARLPPLCAPAAAAVWKPQHRPTN